MQQTDQVDTTSSHPGPNSKSPTHQSRRVRKPLGKDGRGRNRPRASLACLNCRERKIKCTRSVDEPDSCTSCRALELTCAISQVSDRRRVQSREQLSHLQGRVQLLETLLAAQGRQDEFRPDTVTQNETADLDLSMEPPSTSGFGHQSPSAQTSTTALNHTGASSAIPPDVRRPSLGSPGLPQGHLQHSASTDLTNERDSVQARGQGASEAGREWPDQQAATSVPFMANNQTSLTNEPHQNEKAPPNLVFDLEKGQPCFYGPTSQLHIRSSASPPSLSPESSTSSVPDIKLNSTRVQEILIQTFWDSQPLSTAIVERPRFEQGRKSAVRSEYWSSFLENALLACASRMRTSADMRALGPRYCDLAASEIVEELQRPQISTVQGFLLLSDFEATRGKDRLGYQYCGIACRMIFDLGLHESCSALVAQGCLTSADEVTRCLLFLGTYVYDTLWSLYLGRPSVIPSSSLQAVQSRLDNVGNALPPLLSAWVGLCAEIAEATAILNDKSVPLNPVAVKQLIDLDARISRRSDTLASTLAFNADQISELAVNAFGLHVQLRGIRIVLHKRLSQTLTANGADSLSTSDQSFEHSTTVMHDSAVLIARLTSTYVRIFGIENVITVMLDNMFVAAATLIEHQLRPNRAGVTRSTETDVSWLHSLSNIFQRAQTHYPVTARMLSALSGLVHGTFIAGVFPGGSDDAVSNKPPIYTGEHQHGQGKRTAADNVNQMGWSMDLSLGMDPQFRQDQSSNWFLDGLSEHDTVSFGALDMDPNNAMGWLMSPMES